MDLDKENEWSIRGKVVMITGANAGIGKTTALSIAALHPKKLILACRNLAAAEEAANDIRQQVPKLPADVVVIRHVDLASLDSVRQCAAETLASEHELHVLINNAGVIGPARRQVTPDGYEVTFATNHLGHFLLTNLLLGLLKKSAPSRVINVCADAYKFTWPRGLNIDDVNAEQPGRYNPWSQYCQSKLANLLFTAALHNRLNENKPASGVSVFSVRPAACSNDDKDGGNKKAKTSMFRNRHIFTKNVDEGTAVTSSYCATMPDIERYSGGYFLERRPSTLWSIATDMEMAEKLWQLSEKMAGLVVDEN